MSSNSPLPNFIQVANIKDLFWNNNSDLYPTWVPTKYHKVENTRPIFLSPYLGTCILTGEFNHCLYNGKYYFLTKLEVIDVQSERYKYQLDYDVMINFMNAGVSVTGTLIKTDRKDILSGCLQTTKAILSDPSKPVYFNTTSVTGEKKVELKLPTDSQVKDRFIETSITRATYDEFIERIEKNAIGKGTVGKKWLCNNKDSIHAQINPIIILDTLIPTPHVNKWKFSLYKRLVDKLKEAVENKQLVIVKQTTPTDHFNVGGNVVGVKNHTIGQNIVSELNLTSIDLSNITGITPIDNKTKKPKPPNTSAVYDHLDEGERIDIKDVGIWTIVRRPYIPVANEKSNEGAFKQTSSRGYKTQDFSEIGLWPGIETPQKIVTQEGDVGYIWHVHKNNLALHIVNNEYSSGRVIRHNHGERAGITMHDPEGSNYYKFGFWFVNYKNLAPIGFLIYQFIKTSDKWEEHTFKAESTNQITLRTGLSTQRVNAIYANPPEATWWANADDSMNALWGNKIFARIHLDLDLLNWMPIAPSDTGYEYKYNNGNYWGYQKFLQHEGNTKWYPSMITRVYVSWKGVKTKNPYAESDKDAAMPPWLAARQKKLDDISLSTTYELPITINRNDLVMSSYEFKFVPIGTWFREYLPYEISIEEWKAMRLVDDGVRQHRTRDASPLVLDDYQNYFTGSYGSIGLTTDLAIRLRLALLNIEPITEPVTTPYPDKSIIMYLYQNEYRLGVLTTYTLNVPLDKSPDNLIKTVNGRDQEEIRIVVIRPFGEAIDYRNNPSITQNNKLDIIQHATGSFTPGAGVDINKTIHYYDEEYMKNGSFTFDLEGTDWYLVVHNGEYNLIPKNNRALGTPDEIPAQIELNGKKDIYTLINQKAELNYYGQTFNLNTKFSLNETFEYTLTPVVIADEFVDPDVEYQWLKAETENDDIDVLTTLPRHKTRSAEKVDSTQALMMKERLLQLTTNYQQDKYANELMMEDKILAMTRQREDLNSQWWESLFGAVSKPIAGGVAGAMKGGYTGAALGAIGGLGAAKSDITFLIRHPTFMTRLNEDQQNLILANSQALYQRKQNYEHDFKYQTFKLNKIAGSYEKPALSNRKAQEISNEIRGVTNVYLRVNLPSIPQQKQINHIYETFGCECVSDFFSDKPFNIYSSMKGGVYQFSQIPGGGIKSSITDPTLIDILRQILQNGVKFQPYRFSVDNIPDPVEHHPDLDVHIEIDPTKIKTWTRETWIKYKNITKDSEVIKAIKALENYGLRDEEWNQYKDKIRTDTDQHLLEDIDKIIRSRDTGEIVVIGKVLPTIKELALQLEELEARTQHLTKQTETLQAEKEALETRINDVEGKRAKAEADLQTTRQQVTNLETEKADVERQLADCQQNIETYSQDIESLNDQLRKCKVDLDNAVKAQETVGTVNTAEIKTLRAKVKELEATIASKTADLDSLKKECDDHKKKLADEIQSHKEDKEDLTQQLNNERRIVLNKTDEVNRLIKEKENLENQKFDIERQLRESIEAKDKVQKQLDRCRKDKPRPGRPTTTPEGCAPTTTIPNECNLMRDLLNDPYEIDIKERDNGLSRMTDLLSLIVHGMNFMRGTQDEGILMMREPMKKIILKLEAFQLIPVVDEVYKVLKGGRNDWKFIKWLEDPSKPTDGTINSFIEKFDKITTMLKPNVVHGIKAALDDLNYLVYKAKEELGDVVNTDDRVRYFFKHVYPGNTPPVYRDLFGNPDSAIVRKRFINEVECPREGLSESVISILDKINKGTFHTGDLSPAPALDPTFMGIPLTVDERFFIHPFNWFKDTTDKTTFQTGVDDMGIPLRGVEILPQAQHIIDGANTSVVHRTSRPVTFYNQWGGTGKVYLIKETGDLTRIRDAALHLWRNRKSAQISEAWAAAMNDPNGAPISLVMAGIQQHGVWQRNTTVIGGKGSLLQGLRHYTTDFILLLNILEHCRYVAKKWASGMASTVVGGEKSPAIQITGEWRTEWWLLNIESDVKTKTSYQLGWTVPTEYIDDLKTNLDSRLGTGSMSKRQASMYRLLSWMYAIVSQPNKAEELIHKMFDEQSPFGKFLARNFN